MISAILYTALAVSFGWGMRGALIGGEKGAMLPGALLGTCLALMSGVPVIEENFAIFAAVGALGMGYGGFEPYAQTMSLILDHSKGKHNTARGYTGLGFKGALWFGIAAAFLGMAFSGMTGEVYRWYDFLLVTAPIPLVQYIGVKIFNSPYDKKNGVYPNIYFSSGSREEWGGNLLMLILLITMAVIRRDVFTLIFTASGIVAGAVGWAIGITLMDVTSHPLKRGGFIFGNFQRRGFIDNWKIMEFTLGAFAGGALSLVFVLTFKHFNAAAYENGSIRNVLGSYSGTAAWIACGLMVLTLGQYAVTYLRSKKSGGDAGDTHTLELIERPFIFVIPLALCLLGNRTMAVLIISFGLFYVGVQKAIFEQWNDYKGRGVLAALMSIIAMCIIFVNIFNPDTFTPKVVLVLQCITYEALELTCVLRPKKLAEYADSGRGISGIGGNLTVHPFFILQNIILIVGANIVL